MLFTKTKIGIEDVHNPFLKLTNRLTGGNILFQVSYSVLTNVFFSFPHEGGGENHIKAVII